MTVEQLLEKTYQSSCEAMETLEQFLYDVDNSSSDESRGNYQHLKVIGNRIFD